jgi:hypothetical protein
MDRHELIARRLGVSRREAEELLAVECPGAWRWTKADVADAIREWTALHGEPPRDRDWRGGPGRRLLRLRGPASKWPDPKTVTARFEIWEEAVFFALSGREWKQDVIDPDDPTANLRGGDIRTAVRRLVAEFIVDAEIGAALPDREPDPRWGLPGWLSMPRRPLQ